ncbi:MAG: hypothetical protein R6V16_06250 [Bacteroidales bacterium]
MDFNDIKNTWKKSFNNDKTLDKSDIELILRIKTESNTALKKVKRNYKVELIICSITSILVIAWFLGFTSGKVLLLITGLNILFFSFLILFCWNNYRKIKNRVISTDKLKPALIKTIKDIERYVNFNKSNFTRYILLPFSAIYGMSIGFLSRIDDLSWNEVLTHLNNKVFISSIITLFVVCIIFIPFSQYLNKKMYKQHLDELKRCLNEFNEFEK